jgi:hypothetical protein
MMKKYFFLGIAMYLLFLIFWSKAIWFPNTNLKLKSPDVAYIKVAIQKEKKQKLQSIQKKSIEINDSIKIDQKAFNRYFPHVPNDTIKRVLLVGDSQLENLKKPIRKRLMDNNYQLVGSIIWYGSSTKQWANSDTLNYFISKFKPDFVIIALGLNELFVNDLPKRQLYAENIKQKLDKAQMPYYFIGPAAWVKDKGITSVLQSTFGDLFYPSHLLDLDRASDGRHPSKKGGFIWFNQVANQMSSKGILHLELNKDTLYRGDSHTVLLKVPKE